jgi:hypothetical protein
VDQISGTTTSDAPAQALDGGQPADTVAVPDPSGFVSRGRIRRRARFLRKARELAYRDLGGLVFNLHRFGTRNDALVLAKLNLLGQIDRELRGLESALGERQSITVLREAGITACPRCAAIHSSEDRFCPNCGLSMGRHPDLPIAVGPSASAPTDPAPAVAAPAPAATQPTAPVPAPAGTSTAAPDRTAPPASTVPPATDARERTPTQSTAPFPAVPAGRAPKPPAAATTDPVPEAQPAPAQGLGDQPAEGEVTEIVRPPAQGS